MKELNQIENYKQKRMKSKEEDFLQTRMFSR